MIIKINMRTFKQGQNGMEKFSWIDKKEDECQT